MLEHRPTKPGVACSTQAGCAADGVSAPRRTYPAPETTHAVLFCTRGCGWTGHAFAARQASGGADHLIFVDGAGHERAWGNEGTPR